MLAWQFSPLLRPLRSFRRLRFAPPRRIGAALRADPGRDASRPDVFKSEKAFAFVAEVPASETEAVLRAYNRAADLILEESPKGIGTTHPGKAPHPSMATPVKGGIPPMSPGAGNAVHPVSLNTGTMPRDVLVAIRQRRRHDLPNKVSVCCFPITWDEAYEFTAPKPRQWWRRWLLWLGCSVNDYGGTMFEVIDGLYEEGKINRTQMSQLEALVRCVSFYFRAVWAIGLMRSCFF